MVRSAVHVTLDILEMGKNVKVKIANVFIILDLRITWFGEFSWTQRTFFRENIRDDYYKKHSRWLIIRNIFSQNDKMLLD